MGICENIENIRKTLPEGVKLIAVSKTKPAMDIEEAYQCGQRAFGENKVQEMAEKYEILPKDIEWHLIGHLQTNKVKYIAPFVSLIHAVDSLKLLKVIDTEAGKCNRIIPCLLQFHVAEEETKFGLNEEEACQLLESADYKSLKNIRIAGIMGMATNTDNEKQIRKEFNHLHRIFSGLKERYFSDGNDFKEISMGMSGDYRLAVLEGSTMVRVGSSIFGARNYTQV